MTITTELWDWITAATFAVQIWSWVITAVSVTAVWLAGSHNRWGWVVGLGGQGLWLAYAFAFEQWGFIVHALAFGAIYYRNWRRWTRQGTGKPGTDLDHMSGWTTQELPVKPVQVRG